MDCSCDILYSSVLVTTTVVQCVVYVYIFVFVFFYKKDKIDYCYGLN